MNLYLNLKYGIRLIANLTTMQLADEKNLEINNLYYVPKTILWSMLFWLILVLLTIIDKALVMWVVAGFSFIFWPKPLRKLTTPQELKKSEEIKDFVCIKKTHIIFVRLFFFSKIAIQLFLHIICYTYSGNLETIRNSPILLLITGVLIIFGFVCFIGSIVCVIKALIKSRPLSPFLKGTKEPTKQSTNIFDFENQEDSDSEQFGNNSSF